MLSSIVWLHLKLEILISNELKDKLERMEMHNRKLNICVFKLKSDIDPICFMTNVFKVVFQEKLKWEQQVEIAHRIGTVDGWYIDATKERENEKENGIYR